MSGEAEIHWLVKPAILAMHGMLIVQHGGSSGIRDEGLLESALARPKHLFTYEPSSTLFQLAAAYGYGLGKNHGFVDGNKRIALVAMAVFLEINGYRLEAEEPEAVVIITDLAAGTCSEDQLGMWLEKNSKPT